VSRIQSMAHSFWLGDAYVLCSQPGLRDTGLGRATCPNWLPTSRAIHIVADTFHLIAAAAWVELSSVCSVCSAAHISDNQTSIPMVRAAHVPLSVLGFAAWELLCDTASFIADIDGRVHALMATEDGSAVVLKIALCLGHALVAAAIDCAARRAFFRIWSSLCPKCQPSTPTHCTIEAKDSIIILVIVCYPGICRQRSPKWT